MSISSLSTLTQTAYRFETRINVAPKEHAVTLVRNGNESEAASVAFGCGRPSERSAVRNASKNDHVRLETRFDLCGLHFPRNFHVRS
jgi:hypothetical protein